MNPKTEIPALEQLEDAICTWGTPVTDCDFCKTTWFTGTGEFMEEGELENLMAKRAAEPDKYRIAPNGATSVSWGYFWGRHYVWGCRCGKFLALAAAIYSNLPTISRWAKGIAKEKESESRMAAECATLME